jgi:hypothetical protein
MKPAIITFSMLVDTLQQHYGSPAPLPPTNPLELIIWENVAYLASDRRRAEAFATLRLEQTPNRFSLPSTPRSLLSAKLAYSPT